MSGLEHSRLCAIYGAGMGFGATLIFGWWLEPMMATGILAFFGSGLLLSNRLNMLKKYGITKP